MWPWDRKRVAPWKERNNREMPESVDIWQEQETRCTIITCKQKANAGLFTWPKKRKKRVVKCVEMFSVSDVEVVELDGGEECRVRA